MPSWTSFSVRVSMEEVGFIQNQHRGIGHGSAGNGQQLTLALAQVGAVAGEHRVVAVRQMLDKAVGVGQTSRGDALLIGGGQSAVADVVHHRAGEQMGILQHNAQGGTQGVLLDGLDIVAVIENLALLDIVEAVDQVVMVVLPAPVEPTKAIFWARTAVEVDIVQHDLARVVAEVPHP